MIDPLVTLAVAALTLMGALVAISRLIPDHYDRAVRVRAKPGSSPRR